MRFVDVGRWQRLAADMNLDADVLIDRVAHPSRILRDLVMDDLDDAELNPDDRAFATRAEVVSWIDSLRSDPIAGSTGRCGHLLAPQTEGSRG